MTTVAKISRKERKLSERRPRGEHVRLSTAQPRQTVSRDSRDMRYNRSNLPLTVSQLNGVWCAAYQVPEIRSNGPTHNTHSAYTMLVNIVRRQALCAEQPLIQWLSARRWRPLLSCRSDGSRCPIHRTVFAPRTYTYTARYCLPICRTLRVWRGILPCLFTVLYYTCVNLLIFHV